MLGVGITTLFVYIALIIILNVYLKRSMGESMLRTCLVMLIIGSALFGMISGVASASAASIGSVTIPWMQESGWSKERSASIVAGNGGLGNVFPPSSVMLLVPGLDAVSSEVSSDKLYIGLMSVAWVVLIVRLVIVFIFAKQEGLKPVPRENIMPLGKALRENGRSLIIFLGILIPLMATMFGSGELVAVRLAGTNSSGASSMIIILSITTIITMMVGPFNATGTTSAMGAVCYMAMRSIGIPPAAACVAFINLVSNQSCIPPNSAPIYIVCWNLYAHIDSFYAYGTASCCGSMCRNNSRER